MLLNFDLRVGLRTMMREVPVGELSTGMYITELDRPWIGTPFPIQGFYVRTKQDIDDLTQYCEFVVVDPRRYDAKLAYESHARALERRRKIAKRRVDIRPRKAVVYEEKSSFDEEVPIARVALREATETIEPVLEQLVRTGATDLGKLRIALNPLIDSVVRNKDALAALVRLQRIDNHTYAHCIAVSVWAALLGRQLGFDPKSLKTLAFGCALQDVGKLRLPIELLRHEDPLVANDLDEVKVHVEHSMDILDEHGVDDEMVRNIVAWHHERADGCGYPDQLSLEEIPVFARIGGLVDTYDAMINARATNETRSSFQAITDLRIMTPEKFQEELVETLAQAIGVFPNGALVELNTGQVGIVIAQNETRRLRPKIMIILDADKKPADELLILDLTAHNPQKTYVRHELGDGAYGVDATQYFLD